MSERPEDDLNPLADALRTLRPQPVELDRAVLMFQAGRASARYGWAWPALCAALVLLSLGLGAALVLRPDPQHVVEVHTVLAPAAPLAAPPTARREEPVPEPSPPAVVADIRSELPRESYLGLLRRAERDGDLKPAPAERVAPSPPRLDNLLDLPGETLKEPWLLRRQRALQSGDPS